MSEWPSQHVKAKMKLDTSPVISMVKACREMLQNMTIRQWQAYTMLDLDDPSIEGAPWLRSLPEPDHKADPQWMARTFAMAMSDLQAVLTAFRLQAGYKLDEAFDEHPCMQWTTILFQYPVHLDEHFEVFDMLEITLAELPEYVSQNYLKPVLSVETPQMKRTRRVLRMMRN